MSRLTQDGTAEPVLRDKILSRNGDRDMSISPVQLTTNRIIDKLTYQLIHTTAPCDDQTTHIYIYIYIIHNIWSSPTRFHNELKKTETFQFLRGPLKY